MPRYLLRYPGREMRLPDHGSVVIGRDLECDIVLDDAAVSRRHAQLSIAIDGVWIEDQGSPNGVVVNGRPGAARSRLVPGDSFRIGRTLFTLEFSSGRPSSPPPPSPSGPRAGSFVSTEVLMADVSLVQYAQARGALGDEQKPLPERILDALGAVQQLYDAGALANARALLGDALDALIASRAAGLLPALTVIRARRLVSQLASHLGDDPLWSARLEALARAETR